MAKPRADQLPVQADPSHAGEDLAGMKGGDATVPSEGPKVQRLVEVQGKALAEADGEPAPRGRHAWVGRTAGLARGIRQHAVKQLAARVQLHLGVALRAP